MAIDSTKFPTKLLAFNWGNNIPNPSDTERKVYSLDESLSHLLYITTTYIQNQPEVDQVLVSRCKFFATQVCITSLSDQKIQLKSLQILKMIEPILSSFPSFTIQLNENASENIELMGYCTELLYNESKVFKALFDFKGTDSSTLTVDLRGKNFKKEDFLILLDLLNKKTSSFNFYREEFPSFLRIAKIVDYLGITYYESIIDELLLNQLKKIDFTKEESLEAILVIYEQTEDIENKKLFKKSKEFLNNCLIIYLSNNPEKMDEIKDRIVIDIDYLNLAKGVFDNSNFSDDQLKNLIRLFPNLTKIAIVSDIITDQRLIEIAKMQNLEELFVTGKKLTSKGLEAFVGHPSLRSLEIPTGPWVTDEGMRFIAEIPHLKEFKMTRCIQILNNSFQIFLSKLPHLQVLHLSYAEITDDFLASVATHRKLKSLDISNCEKLTNKGLESLVDHPNLLELFIDNNWLTNEGLSFIAKIPNLQYLYLASARGLSTGALTSFKEHKNLKTIDFTMCNSISDIDLVDLAKIESLEEVYLDCRNVTEAGRSQLQQALPNLKIN